MAEHASIPDGGVEAALLERARAFPGHPTLAELASEVLREITAHHGVDFSTALLFDRVSNSRQHAAFIERVERAQQDVQGNIRAAGSTVAVVPASFYREKPHSGADGRVIREAAAQLGFRSELIPVNSTGTLAQNSRILLDWLAEHGKKGTILISLCKGGADVKFALNQPDAARSFANVRAWINVCGTLNGSPVAQWLLAGRARFLATWLLFKFQRLNIAFLRELAPSPHGPLHTSLRLPPTLPLVSVIGFPLRHHLTNGFMRRCHQIISPQGPNDGGVLLGDVCRLPGALYPVWGADHYLRPEDRSRRIVAAILNCLMVDDIPAALSPAAETPANGQILKTLSV